MNLRKILTGVFLSVVITFISVCLLAILVYFSDIQDRTVSAIIFALSAISVFLGAFLMARNIPGKGLLNGVVLALIYVLFLAAISLLVNGRISFNMSNFLRLISIIASGALGGILGINMGYKTA